MQLKKSFFGVALALFVLAAGPVNADLSAYVAAVGFDEDADLDGGMGIGVRWGKSGSILGGETSLLIARPTREISVQYLGQADGKPEILERASKKTATALFYEGRFMINLPTGTPVRPFANVGLGAITVTSTDLDDLKALTDSEPGLADALNAADAVGDLQTSTSLSYGLGVKYALSDRLELRADVRQYLVFSVTGYAEDKAKEELQEKFSEQLEGSSLEGINDIIDSQANGSSPAKDNTVQYNELSVGLNIRF